MTSTITGDTDPRNYGVDSHGANVRYDRYSSYRGHQESRIVQILPRGLRHGIQLQFHHRRIREEVETAVQEFQDTRSRHRQFTDRSESFSHGND